MTDFALVNLSTLAVVGSPGPLPQTFVGLSIGSLADLSFTGTDLGGAYVDRGYWPVADEKPALAPGQRYATPPAYTVNEGPKTVTATYSVEPDPATAPAATKAEAKANTDASLRDRARRLAATGRPEDKVASILLLNEKGLLK
jgi:hypothetical protein